MAEVSVDLRRVIRTKKVGLDIPGGAGNFSILYPDIEDVERNLDPERGLAEVAVRLLRTTRESNHDIDEG